MSITVTVTPGKQFGSSETVTNDKLNQLGQPTFVITGTVATSDLSSGAVTAAKTTADAYNFATATWAAVAGFDEYTLSFSPGTGPTSLVNGLEVWWLVPADNTQANGTKVDVGGGGGKKGLLKKIHIPLVIGDLIAGQIIGMRYNTATPAPTSTGSWELITEPLLPDTFRITTAGTAPNYTGTISTPAGANSITLTQLQGRPIILKMHADGAGADNLQLTIGTAAALGNKSIRKNFNQATGALDLRQNQEVIVVYDSSSDTFQMQGQVGNPSFLGGPVAEGRNIAVFNDAGTPLSKVGITADEVILKPTTGGPTYYLATAVSLTLDIGGTVSAPLGLDTGAEAASTWYYVWLIYNGTAVSGVFSVSSGAPTLAGALAGYKWAAMIGCVRNDAGSNFTTFIQYGRTNYQNESIIFTNKGASALAAIGGAELTVFQGFVPPIAKSWFGYADSVSNNSSVIQLQADSNRLGQVVIQLNSSGTSITDNGVTNFGGSQFELPIKVAQSFNYATAVAAATPVRLFCTGFKF